MHCFDQQKQLNEHYCFITQLYITSCLLQISFTSSARSLKRDTIMSSSSSSYFQLFPSDDNLASAIISLLKAYNWTQVSIITEKEDLFLKVWIAV